ncbi:ECF RNA polymerase sigma factor SigW [Planctomycetes bacterium Pan216]|uniref:RNA polymerase sigma factor n=1 Tax=Kolteria novifilia TaxID=2527975 RepID=A0A518BC63_9BACT|nr:ECF RNA polymerase sigma factor SigW [Planctomycetes bacterium Pan216]
MATADSQSAIRDPDARLMLMVRDGNTGAFEQLVDKYRSRLVGVLYQLVGNADEAEDLAQDVFLRVYRARDNYQPTAKFSTWLFTIANNLALNALRSRRRKPTSQPPATESGGMGGLEQMVGVSSGAMPSRIFAKGEMAEIIRLAISRLSEEQRMAVMLNKYEGMNYRQIAEVMNKSEMAIKSLLSRARYALKEILEPYLANGQAPGP